MTSAYDRYRAADLDLPEESWAWNLYGAGEENMGKDDQPELLPIPEPNADQMLVRIDSVGLCFSDVKILRQGGSHPKLYNRDLAKEPTRLGHEVSLTVIEVGENLKDRYHAGQRLAVQPDIYQDGKSTAYGYTIPGGLIQYHLMGSEMLDTDDGACLLPLPDTMGYAEASTLEPWGCVMAAYTQRRRLEPRTGGTMWIIGRPGDEREYLFSSGLDAPATIVMTDVPASVEKLVEHTSAKTVVRNGIGPDDLSGFGGRADRRRRLRRHRHARSPFRSDGGCRGQAHCPAGHPQPGGRDRPGRPGGHRRGPPALRLHRLSRRPGSGHRRLLRGGAQPLRPAFRGHDRLRGRRRPHGVDARPEGHPTARRPPQDRRHGSER